MSYQDQQDWPHALSGPYSPRGTVTPTTVQGWVKKYKSESNNGYSAIAAAIWRGNTRTATAMEIIQELIDSGEPPESLTGSKNSYNRYSALHAAAQFPDRDQLPFMQLLIDNGVNPNIQDSIGRTPLHWLGSEPNMYDQPERVDLLIKNGSDPSLRDKFGLTALDCCVYWNEKHTGSSNKPRILVSLTEHSKLHGIEPLPLEEICERSEEAWADMRRWHKEQQERDGSRSR